VDIFVAAFVVAGEEQEKVADQKTAFEAFYPDQPPSRAIPRRLCRSFGNIFEVRFRLSVPILTGRWQLSLQLLSTDFQ